MTEDRSVHIFNNWEPITFNIPKPSNWTCYLFGGNASFSSITWTPGEGK